MPPFASDSFTGSALAPLAAHDVAWTRHPLFAGGLRIAASGNTAEVHEAGPCCWYRAQAPGSADYDVSVMITHGGAPADQSLGPAGRIDPASDTMYFARYAHDLGRWELYRSVSGVVTQIGATFTQVLVPGRAYKCTLRMRGTAISVLIDDVERIPPAGGGDASIVDAGRAGIRGYAAGPATSDGYFLGEFSAEGDATTVNPAGSYSLSGPAGAVAGHPSAEFTVTLGEGALAGTIRLTPKDGYQGGTFIPAYLELTDTVRSGSFRYVPASVGVKTIAVVNDRGLTDPPGVSLAVRPAGSFRTIKAGDWSDPSVWAMLPGPTPDGWAGAVPPPGEGDVVTVGHPLNVDVPVVIGCGLTCRRALDLAADLTILDGACLTVRGDVLQRNGVVVTGLGAGCLRFDAAGADPATCWTWQISDSPAAAAGARLIVRGRPEARFRIESATGGGNGRFTGGGAGQGCSVDAEYCDFVRIGDANSPAFAPALGGGGNVFRIDHGVLVGCGAIAPPDALHGSCSFVLTDSVWIESAAMSVDLPAGGAAAPEAGAVWSISGCDFQGPVSLRSAGFALAGNRFRSPWALDGVAQAATAGPHPATYLALAGPDSGVAGVASGPMTASLGPPGASVAAEVTVTPSDGGAGGSFAPPSVSLGPSAASATFTYARPSTGPSRIRVAGAGALPGGNGPLWELAPLDHAVTQVATGYRLVPPEPATGVAGGPSAPFRVELPDHRTLAAPVTITPHDGGAGGSFTPPSVVLSTVNPSAAFTYTASGPEGARAIATTNDGGLTDPAPAAFTVAPPVEAYTLSGPTAGEVGRSTDVFTVALGSGALSGSVRINLIDTGGGGAFDPPAVDLSNGTRIAGVLYRPTRWGTRNIAASNDRGLSDPVPVSYLAKIQTGRSGHDSVGNRTPDLGGYELFAIGPWWQEMARDVTGDPVDPDSDTYIGRLAGLSLRVDGSTTTANGGDSVRGYPCNTVSGGQPLVPLTSVASPADSDPGPAPIPRDVTIKAIYRGDGTPPPDQGGGDQHLILYKRDEATGRPSELWEYRGAYSEDGGLSWKAAGGARFNLLTGEPRRDGWASGDASGLPIAPLTVSYEEARRGDVGHAIRVTLGGWRGGSPLLRDRYVWPARHTSYAGAAADGLPFGARLRLKASWYEANKAAFGGIPRTIVDAMRRYGLIVADVGEDLCISLTQDERWDVSGPDGILNLQSIPAEAFEVLELRSHVIFSGPSSGLVGVPVTFTVTHRIDADTNFSNNVSLLWTSDVALPEADRVWRSTGLSPAVGTLSPSSRSFAFAFLPPAPGPYLLRADPNVDWIEPPDLAFTAAALANTYRLTGPGTGEVGEWTGPYTVALDDYTTVAGPVTITPGDGGDGGSFSPPSVVLSAGTRSASFIYRAASAGRKTIACTSDGGLADPPGLSVTISIGRRAITYLPPRSHSAVGRAPLSWGGADRRGRPTRRRRG